MKLKYLKLNLICLVGEKIIATQKNAITMNRVKGQIIVLRVEGQNYTKEIIEGGNYIWTYSLAITSKMEYTVLPIILTL